MLNTSGQDLKFMFPTEVHSWQPSIECVVHTPWKPARGWARGQRNMNKAAMAVRGRRASHTKHEWPG